MEVDTSTNIWSVKIASRLKEIKFCATERNRKESPL